VKPDIKPFEFFNAAKGWLDEDKRMDDQPRTELEERQRDVSRAVGAAEERSGDAEGSSFEGPYFEKQRIFNGNDYVCFDDIDHYACVFVEESHHLHSNHVYDDADYDDCFDNCAESQRDINC